MGEAILDVRADIRTRSGVEAVTTIPSRLRISRVDHRLRLLQAYRAAHQLLRHTHQAGVGQVVVDGLVRFQDVGKVAVMGKVDAETAAADRVSLSGRLEIPLQPLHRRQQAAHLVSR